MARILILHPERSARKVLEKQASAHHEVQAVSDVRKAVKSLAKARPQLVLAGVNGKRTDAFELLRHMQQERLKVPTLLLAAGGAGAFQSVAMKMGASAVLEYPLEQQALDEAISKALTASWEKKGAQPDITSEELAGNLTELEARLNRQMKCFAGKNQVYIQSFILGCGRKSKPRIAVKCSLKQEYGEPPNVYYEYVRDVCCGNPETCSAYQTFKIKHPNAPTKL